MINDKQLPAVIHPIPSIYQSLNLSLKADCASVESIAMNVCAPILFFAALQDDEEVKAKMDEYGIDPDNINVAAENALDIFKSFMEFE